MFFACAVSVCYCEHVFEQLPADRQSLPEDSILLLVSFPWIIQPPTTKYWRSYSINHSKMFDNWMVGYFYWWYRAKRLKTVQNIIKALLFFQNNENGCFSTQQNTKGQPTLIFAAFMVIQSYTAHKPFYLVLSCLDAGGTRKRQVGLSNSRM